MFSGGETASSPNTIPPKISKFGDVKKFECKSMIFSLWSFIFCKSFLQNILFLVLFFVMMNVQGTFFHRTKCTLCENKEIGVV